MILLQILMILTITKQEHCKLHTTAAVTLSGKAVLYKSHVLTTSLRKDVAISWQLRGLTWQWRYLRGCYVVHVGSFQ